MGLFVVSCVGGVRLRVDCGSGGTSRRPPPRLGSWTRWRLAGAAPTAPRPSPNPRGLSRLQVRTRHPRLPPALGRGCRGSRRAGPGWATGSRAIGPGRRCPGRCVAARGQEVTTSPLYLEESWLSMSPLKCSNFLSVSSLKEPPMWQLYIQMRWPS